MNLLRCWKPIDLVVTGVALGLAAVLWATGHESLTGATAAVLAPVVLTANRLSR